VIEDDVRGFIADNLAGNGVRDTLDDDFPLLERGVIDSMGLVDLVSFLEEEYRIRFRIEELAPDNFGTISAIASMIRSKQDGRGQGPQT